MGWASAILVIAAVLSLGCALNTDRKGRRREIANGVQVDYSTIKSSYSFMIRLIMDGAFRCGGALISDR